MQFRNLIFYSFLTNALAAAALRADEIENDQPPPAKATLVDEFTADTLEHYQFKLGTKLEYGLSSELSVGTDLIATAIGAPTALFKARIFKNAAHSVSLGLRGTFVTKDTILWGNVSDHFDRLDARILRPGIVWTNRVSERLRIHTYWAKSL